MYRIFLKGLLTLLPITLTLYLLVWIATRTEGALSEPLRNLFPTIFGIPGAGFLLAILLVFLVGLLVNSYVTRRFVEWLEHKLDRLPIVRAIYSPIRDVTQLFAHKDGEAQRVVMVQLETGGIEFMGLVTRDQFNDLPPATVPPTSVAVFIPFSYGMGGFTVLVPKARVRETSLPAERAMQLAITGWIKSSK